MAKWERIALILAVSVIVPFISHAQVAESMKGMHGVLEQLLNKMIPLCSKLIGVGQGLAGFAAIWYIVHRVGGSLARAEPIDFYPLLRPFAIGFCILFFPNLVLGVINGVMKPVVTATAEMVEDSNKAIAALLQQKEDAIKNTPVWQMYVGESGSGDRDKWYKYTHKDADPSGEGFFASIGNDIKFAMEKAYYRFSNTVKEWMSEVLQILFQAASLCIDTLRTFQLVVLAILGPLVFGISVFDGFHHTLTAWLSRYINIFLWLPVANIFGSIIGQIQEEMLKLDISQVQSQGDTFFSRTDMAYLVFMIIGILGYFTVPSVANYIVHAGGGGALGNKVTSFFGSSVNRMDKGLDNMASMKQHFQQGYSGEKAGEGAGASIGRMMGRSGAYMADKLKGN